MSRQNRYNDLPRFLHRLWCYADPELDPAPGEGGAGDPPVDPAPGDGDGGDGDGKDSWFAEDWRERYAGENEKNLQRLQRYQSPKAALDALFSAQNRIAAGDLKQSLPEDASAEQLAEYRKANGIPEDPSGYDLKFDDGLVIGEEDKPIIDDYVAHLHEMNASPEMVKKNIEWYFKATEDMKASLSDMDVEQREEARNELAAEWGGDYKANMNILGNVMALFPEAVREEIFHSRLPDRRGLGNNPDVLRGLVAMGRMMGVGSTYVGGGGQESNLESVQERIAAIKATMGTSAYNNNEKVQAELRDLYDAERKMGGKA